VGQPAAEYTADAAVHEVRGRSVFHFP
jgi:hypothetical protein